MNKSTLCFASACAFILFNAPAGFAAGAGSGPKARIFAKYDTNKNGVIDGDEVAALRKDFAADAKGELARYDTDHDGKLSDAEIAAIKPPGSKKAGEKKVGGGKKGTETKSASTEPTTAASKSADPEKKTEAK
jgi:hypothetical protein